MIAGILPSTVPVLSVWCTTFTGLHHPQIQESTRDSFTHFERHNPNLELWIVNKKKHVFLYIHTYILYMVVFNDSSWQHYNLIWFKRTIYTSITYVCNMIIADVATHTTNDLKFRRTSWTTRSLQPPHWTTLALQDFINSSWPEMTIPNKWDQPYKHRIHSMFWCWMLAYFCCFLFGKVLNKQLLALVLWRKE